MLRPASASNLTGHKVSSLQPGSSSDEGEDDDVAHDGAVVAGRAGGNSGRRSTVRAGVPSCSNGSRGPGAGMADTHTRSGGDAAGNSSSCAVGGSSSSVCASSAGGGLSQVPAHSAESRPAMPASSNDHRAGNSSNVEPRAAGSNGGDGSSMVGTAAQADGDGRSGGSSLAPAVLSGTAYSVISNADLRQAAGKLDAVKAALSSSSSTAAYGAAGSSSELLTDATGGGSLLNTAGDNLAGSGALFSRTGWASLRQQPGSNAAADKAAVAREPAGMA
ncbi:hypothetical protein COO60DRAFT_1490231 [Scenedesmus sp. NREL 46B-D3]|nr:hypothetical protein COO60DRAFT_1490231 [Scenedesmus sp. NREL 46B-D3]